MSCVTVRQNNFITLPPLCGENLMIRSCDAPGGKSLRAFRSWKGPWGSSREEERWRGDLEMFLIVILLVEATPVQREVK